MEEEENLLWSGNKPNLMGNMAAHMRENAGENSKIQFYRKKTHFEVFMYVQCLSCGKFFRCNTTWNGAIVLEINCGWNKDMFWPRHLYWTWKSLSKCLGFTGDIATLTEAWEKCTSCQKLAGVVLWTFSILNEYWF